MPVTCGFVIDHDELAKIQYEAQETNHFPLRSDFAESIVYSWSNGNELEFAAACVSDDAADALKRKIDKALVGCARDISLWLTDDEAMCLAVASQNCQTNGLPIHQTRLIDAWHKRWMESDYAAFKEEN